MLTFFFLPSDSNVSQLYFNRVFNTCVSSCSFLVTPSQPSISLDYWWHSSLSLAVCDFWTGYFIAPQYGFSVYLLRCISNAPCLANMAPCRRFAGYFFPSRTLCSELPDLAFERELRRFETLVCSVSNFFSFHNLLPARRRLLPPLALKTLWNFFPKCYRRFN